MMKLLDKFRDKLFDFNYYHNPFYHWFKARKYFKFPLIKIITNKCRSNTLLIIKSYALWWKDVDNSPKFICNPRIIIWIFKRYVIEIMFTYYKNDRNVSNVLIHQLVWIAILNHLYYNKSIKSCNGNNTRRIMKDCKFALTKKAIKAIWEEEE